MTQVKDIDKKISLVYDKVAARIAKIKIVTALSPISLMQVDTELNGILLDLQKLKGK